MASGLNSCQVTWAARREIPGWWANGPWQPWQRTRSEASKLGALSPLIMHMHQHVRAVAWLADVVLVVTEVRAPDVHRLVTSLCTSTRRPTTRTTECRTAPNVSKLSHTCGNSMQCAPSTFASISVSMDPVRVDVRFGAHFVTDHG